MFPGYNVWFAMFTLLEDIQAMISFRKKQMQIITTQGYSELTALPFSTILTRYLIATSAWPKSWGAQLYMKPSFQAGWWLWVWWRLRTKSNLIAFSVFRAFVFVGFAPNSSGDSWECCALPLWQLMNRESVRWASQKPSIRQDMDGGSTVQC